MSSSSSNYLPLTADDSSQTSQRSALSGSLLERIRAQRDREQGGGGSVAARSPSPLVVPSYSPLDEDRGGLGSSLNSSNNRWSFNIAWPKWAQRSHPSEEGTESLLSAEPHVPDDEEYSMTRYLHTFVQDVYNSFRKLHPIAQGMLVVVSLFLVFKLLTL